MATCNLNIPIWNLGNALHDILRFDLLTIIAGPSPAIGRITQHLVQNLPSCQDYVDEKLLMFLVMHKPMELPHCLVLTLEIAINL